MRSNAGHSLPSINSQPFMSNDTSSKMENSKAIITTNGCPCVWCGFLFFSMTRIVTNTFLSLNGVFFFFFPSPLLLFYPVRPIRLKAREEEKIVVQMKKTWHLVFCVDGVSRTFLLIIFRRISVSLRIDYRSFRSVATPVVQSLQRSIGISRFQWKIPKQYCQRSMEMEKIKMVFIRSRSLQWWSMTMTNITL